MQVTDEMIEKAKAELFKSGMVDVFSVRAALTAALSVQERAVEVKKLEWRDRSSEGEYAIRWDTRGSIFTYVAKAVRLNDMILCNGRYHANIEAAKAAAQSDYEQRIRSALVDVPVEPKSFCAMLTTGVCEKDAEIKRLRDNLDRLRPPHREGEDSAEVYRHKKRGSTYTVIARGRLQVDGDLDMEKVTVYRGEDGQVWVRPDYEFNDGRFEALTTSERSSNAS